MCASTLTIPIFLIPQHFLSLSFSLLSLLLRKTMELLSVSSTLSPQLLPLTPSSSSSSSSSSSLKSPQILPKSPLSKPTLRISTPRNSFKIPQVTKPSLLFDQGFDDAGLTTSLLPPAPPIWVDKSDVKGLLMAERNVFLGGYIDDDKAEAIMYQLFFMDAQDHTKDIRLFINSDGGSFSAAMTIFDAVKLVRADVSTVALGIAASTAAVILGGGTKGKRFAMPNARILIHEHFGSVGGPVTTVDIQVKEVMQSMDVIIRTISESTGRTFEQVQDDIDKDFFMSPIEAVEYGLIDGIIDRGHERVKSAFNFGEIMKDPGKFLTPENPDDKIY